MRKCHFCAFDFRESDFSVRNDEWPAQSPDLPNLEFYLWGLLKERTYQYNPQTVTELKETIGKEITNIGSEVTKAVNAR